MSKILDYATKNPQVVLIVLGVGIAAIYLKKNGVQGATFNLATAAVDAVNGVLSGTVVGIGQVVGIPQTDLSQCQKDMNAGNKWDASFSCDAGTYLKWLANGAPNKKPIGQTPDIFHL